MANVPFKLAKLAMFWLSLAGAGSNPAFGQDERNFSVSDYYVWYFDDPDNYGLEAALTTEASKEMGLREVPYFVEFELVGPGVEALRHLKPKNRSLPDADAMTPLCGVDTGRNFWLMALDDGSGTPIDWGRQVMLHRGSKKMQIFANTGPYALLILSAIAARQGLELDVTHADSDAEALMEAKRSGNGFALIDPENANARGFDLALDIFGTGTNDAPGVLDLGIGDLPAPIITVYMSHFFVDVDYVMHEATAAAANRACARFGDRALSQEQVQDWQAALSAVARTVGRED